MNAIAEPVRSNILAHLAEIEREHEVRILYACESGSRAWGFESQDSDYDVRFLYVHPVDWYLSINVEHKRDVIELPISDDLDINGWDLRKALKLFQKSNPPLMEWLVSPIVYREQGPLAARLRSLAAEMYNPIAAHYHYLRMASGNFKANLQGESIRHKKYLYVLRPLLAVKWIEQQRGVVPTEFDKLLAATVDDEALRSEIQELIRHKKNAIEAEAGPRLPLMHAYIETELAHYAATTPDHSGLRGASEVLDALFREIVNN